MGEVGDLLLGEDTPKDTMLTKQASFCIQKKSNFTMPNVFEQRQIRSKSTTIVIMIWKSLKKLTASLRDTVM